MKSSFKLRKPKKSDLKSYWKNKNDKELDRGFIHYSYPYTLAAAKQDLAEEISNNKKKDRVNWLIDVDGEIAGGVSFANIIPKLSAKIGYWLGKDFRGKGIMTQAVNQAIDFMFRKYKIRRIYGNVRTHNKKSAKVLERCGFKLEGIQRKSSMKRGKYFDDYLYARVR